MQVGDKIWYFDETRRVYFDDNGSQSPIPIYRKKFMEKYIVGETRGYWLLHQKKDADLSFSRKIKKADANKLLFTEQAMEETCWMNENRYSLAEKVKESKEYEKLKRIFEILNS